MTESTRITMWLADQAIRHPAPVFRHPEGTHRGSHLPELGRGGGSLAGIIIRSNICHILADIKRAVPLTPDQESAIEQEMKPGVWPGRHHPPGSAQLRRAGFICNRYEFMGPSYSVSAACATSLVHCTAPFR